MKENQTSSSWQASLVETLHSYQRQGLFCDVKLVTSTGNLVAAHSGVLASVSPVIYHRLVNSEQRVLNVNISPVCCQKLLDFIYTRVCDCCTDERNEIAKGCRELGVTLDLLDVERSDGSPPLAENSEDESESYEHIEDEPSDLDEDTVVPETRTLVIEVKPNDTDTPSIRIKRDTTAISSTIGSTSEKPKLSSKSRARTHRYTVKSAKTRKCIFKCRMCQKICNTLRKRTRHENSEHAGQSPYTCVDCQASYSKLSDYRKHMKEHTGGRPFKCKHCDMAFPAKAKLEYHENIHKGVKPHKCDVCKRSFRNRYSLLLHMKQHTGDLLFNCKYCGLEFRSRYRFTWHKRAHVLKNNSSSDAKSENVDVINEVGLRPYSCQHCSKCFPTPWDVKLHERIHTGVKPFPCSFCGEKFTQKSSMKTHEATHTGQKAHKCSVCDKSFIRPSRLAEHMRRHTGDKPFTCEYCGIGFATKGGLSTHEKTIHTKQNLHPCQTCGKSFAKPSLLKIHQRSHTGERPFLCPVCGKSFAHSSFLSRHVKSHKRSNTSASTFPDSEGVLAVQPVQAVLGQLQEPHETLFINRQILEQEHLNEQLMGGLQAHHTLSSTLVQPMLTTIQLQSMFDDAQLQDASAS